MKRKERKQVNVELTECRHDLLLYFAAKTESDSTNGLNRGEPSVGAFVRRICEGKIEIYYQGKKVAIPFKKFLEIAQQ